MATVRKLIESPDAQGAQKRAPQTDLAIIKRKVIGYIAAGYTVRQAMAKVDRTEATYNQWRYRDEDFAQSIDRVRFRLEKEKSGEDTRAEVGDFGEWRQKYLNRTTYAHQWQWVDILEGREPRELHDSQTYLPGRATRLLVNTPPFHAKSPLALDTEVLTTTGWTTIGGVQPGQRVFGPDGKPATVLAKSEVFEDHPCFRVTFTGGESFVATGDHEWTLADGRTVSTSRLVAGDRLPAIEPLSFEGHALPLDPYLFGCWLGDGHTANGRFTSADHEVVAAFAAQFDVTQVASVRNGKARTYETRGLYRVLAEMGVRGSKFIPEGYLIAGYEERLALLQGLMDTDGTISAFGQCSFTNTNYDLARGVQYLASSLGLRPTIRQFATTLNGRDCGPGWTVTFTPGEVQAFRLPRKLVRQRQIVSHEGGARRRRVVSVEPVPTVPTQCLAVDNDSHLFLIGRGLIPTHNTTITMDWVTYKICENPNVRIIVVSESKDMAQKFLTGIKDRLTNPRYQKMHDAFGPAGGFKVGASQWAADKIYVGNRDTSEKDPTVEVLGVGSQIYGARADFIICDDIATLKTGRTEGQRDKIIAWIDQEVSSRLGPTGKLLIVGTRVSANDVYRVLLTRKEGVWTYLAQPAVMAFADEPDDWQTLWPIGNDESGNEVTMWDGPALATRRDEIDTATWSLVYMQQQISEDAVFPEEAVRRCAYQGNVGPLQEGGIRKNGMHGCYVVIGLDPATPAGFTAMVALAVDKQTKVRYVLDVVNMKMTPYTMRQKIRELTLRYKPNEWRIEKNGLNAMVSQDNEIRTFLHSMNCRLVEHQTQGNKWDADFGVASLAPLFIGALEVPPRPLIAIPNNGAQRGVLALMDQLITWAPDTPGKTDCVMALWFADLGCRAVLEKGNVGSFASNRWLTEGQKSKQRVINIADYLDARGIEERVYA